MRNYQIGIIGLGILVGIVIVIGFTLIGSPVSQTTIRYDQTRYTDFQQIKSRIDSYSQNNGTLPSSLSELGRNTVNITDPVTQKQYDYKIIEDARYQLCTEFSTDAEEFTRQAGPIYYDFPVNHTKGYSCVTFGIPDYMLNKPAAPVQ